MRDVSYWNAKKAANKQCLRQEARAVKERRVLDVSSVMNE